MSDLTRKKDTGEPGNPGQFGHTSKPGSGLDLAPAPPAAAAGAVVDAATIATLRRVTAAGRKAEQLRVRATLAGLRTQLADAGVTRVHLDGWGGASDGCRVDGYDDNTGALYLEPFQAPVATRDLLERIEEVATTRDIAEALTGDRRPSVDLDCTPAADHLFDPAQLNREAADLTVALRDDLNRDA